MVVQLYHRLVHQCPGWVEVVSRVAQRLCAVCKSLCLPYVEDGRMLSDGELTLYQQLLTRKKIVAAQDLR